VAPFTLLLAFGGLGVSQSPVFRLTVAIADSLPFDVLILLLLLAFVDMSDDPVEGCGWSIAPLSLSSSCTLCISTSILPIRCCRLRQRVFISL